MASTSMTVRIQGNTVTAVSPEGAKREMKVKDFLAKVSPAEACARKIVMPNGGRMLLARSRLMILLHETPPRVFNFKWITKDSAAKFGQEADYRDVRIALPYVIVMAVFESDTRGNVKLGRRNECFFSNTPLDGLDQPLCFPALLNCSKFDQPEGQPLSWICTQYLERPELRLACSPQAEPNQQLRNGLKRLLHCLFETGFNYSSEFNEGSSWYSESTRVDKRIATVEAWEKATRKNKLFVLDVPWLETKLTAGEITSRIFKNHGLADDQLVTTADDCARLVFNHPK